MLRRLRRLIVLLVLLLRSLDEGLKAAKIYIRLPIGVWLWARAGGDLLPKVSNFVNPCSLDFRGLIFPHGASTSISSPAVEPTSFEMPTSNIVLASSMSIDPSVLQQ